MAIISFSKYFFPIFMITVSLVAYMPDVLAQGVEAKTGAHFDKDNDGLSSEEQVAAIRARIEYEKANDNSQRTINRLEGDIRTQTDGVISVAEFDSEYWNEVLGKNTTLFDSLHDDTFLKYFVLRRSINSLDFRRFETLRDPKSATFQRASGAVFSLTGNPETGDTALTVRGVLALIPQPEGPAANGSEKTEISDTVGKTKDNGFARPFIFLPSVSFDRVNNDSSPAADTNELTPRLTLSYRIKGDARNIETDTGWRRSPGIFDSHVFNVSAAYSTDFDFDSNQILGEFEWFPEVRPLGIASGGYFPELDPRKQLFEYRWRPSFYAQIGDVGSTGSNPNLEQGSFTRIGPRIRLEVWPAARELQRFSFTAAYAILHALDGDSGTTSLLELGIEYQLDRRRRFVLEPFYRTGENLITLQDIDELGVSLTVKF